MFNKAGVDTDSSTIDIVSIYSDKGFNLPPYIIRIPPLLRRNEELNNPDPLSVSPQPSRYALVPPRALRNLPFDE